MQFLCVVRPTRLEMLTDGPTPGEQEIISPHSDYLQALSRKADVVLAGRTLNADERAVGIVVFRADSEDEARHIMNADPAVKSGLMRAELYPFRIAVLAGLDRHEGGQSSGETHGGMS